MREKKQKIGGSVKEICLPNVTLTTIHLMISQLDGHQDGERLKRGSCEEREKAIESIERGEGGVRVFGQRMWVCRSGIIGRCTRMKIRAI